MQVRIDPRRRLAGFVPPFRFGRQGHILVFGRPSDTSYVDRAVCAIQNTEARSFAVARYRDMAEGEENIEAVRQGFSL